MHDLVYGADNYQLKTIKCQSAKRISLCLSVSVSVCLSLSTIKRQREGEKTHTDYAELADVTSNSTLGKKRLPLNCLPPVRIFGTIA